MDFDSDGVRLHYEVNGPEQGTPIIALHGFASDYRLNWAGTRWQETLTQAGFRVVGLDCRGHGHSDKPHDTAAYAIELMAGDVVRLLDHLDIATAAYIGYSMGARLGMQVALDRPDRISRAAHSGIGPQAPSESSDANERALREAGGPDEPAADHVSRFD